MGFESFKCVLPLSGKAKSVMAMLCMSMLARYFFFLILFIDSSMEVYNEIFFFTLLMTHLFFADEF